jgi:hypothetical protein
MAKATKRRPYKVDYIDITEVVGDKAPVHSRLVRVPTAAEAKDMVRRMSIPQDARIIVGARRFYKALPKESGKLVAVENLFPDERAVEIMELIEAYRASVTERAAALSGPDSPATQAVVRDFKAMQSHDAHERTMDTFTPDLASGPYTTPQLQVATGKVDPIVRTTDGTLGKLDPVSTSAATIADIEAQRKGCEQKPDWTPTVEEYKAMDTTVNMMGWAPGNEPPAEPPLGIHQPEAQAGGRWLFPVICFGTILVLAVLYLIQHAH